jgi:hypothetical protein
MHAFRPIILKRSRSRRRPTINESSDAPEFLVIPVPRSSRGTGMTRVERRPDAIIVGRRLTGHSSDVTTAIYLSGRKPQHQGLGGPSHPWQVSSGDAAMVWLVVERASGRPVRFLSGRGFLTLLCQIARPPFRQRRVPAGPASQISSSIRNGPLRFNEPASRSAKTTPRLACGSLGGRGGIRH